MSLTMSKWQIQSGPQVQGSKISVNRCDFQCRLFPERKRKRSYTVFYLGAESKIFFIRSLNYSFPDFTGHLLVFAANSSSKKSLHQFSSFIPGSVMSNTYNIQVFSFPAAKYRWCSFNIFQDQGLNATLRF